MRKLGSIASVLAVGILAAGGCGKKKSKSDEPPAVGSGSAAVGSGSGSAAVGSDLAAGSGSATPPEPGAPAEMYPRLDTAPALAELDTIPSGERGSGKVAVGDGFRYQVDANAYGVDVGGGRAGYLETGTGFDGTEYSVVRWATKEPFTGTMADLMKRESDAARSAGVEVDSEGLFFDTGGLFIAGKYANASRRAEIERKDRIDYETVVVHDHNAYILHCEADAEQWRNAKATCVARSASFHIAPPP